MEDNQVFTKLQTIGQEHLLQHWELLSDQQRQSLVRQIKNLNEADFHQQQILVKIRDTRKKGYRQFEPLEDYETAGSEKRREQGFQRTVQGEVGCLIVAGGQGTRLGFQGPKGVHPVTAVKNKSLFQFLAERVFAASKQARRPLPMAVMTSPINHERAVKFFEENDLFGLAPDQVTFFPQKTSPFLDDHGDLFLEDIDQIAKGPDGNGAALLNFVEAGVWALWEKRGIRCVNFLQVDNPLADPFDAELIGFHYTNKNEVSVKCVLREDPNEDVGILVKERERTIVMEYSEISLAQRTEVNHNEQLKYRIANIGNYCFDMEFIEHAAKETAKLPWHLAHKETHLWSKNGKTSPVKAWKCEKFIFDVLYLTDRTGAILYPREKCFAPLKGVTGSGTLEILRERLQEFDKRVFEKITGSLPPEGPIELSPAFYYPTQELLQRWKGRPWPKGERYLE